MAIAAIAHMSVFSAKPYHYIPLSEFGEISTHTEKTVVDIEGEDKEATVIEKTETEVKAPGTSIKESVQDIVVEGGQKVVEDVKLTINQAIEPVEKGVTKIQESFQKITVGGSEDEKESSAEIEKCVEEDHQGGELHLQSKQSTVVETVDKNER